MRFAKKAKPTLILTSGNTIYHYSDLGIQLNSFTFPFLGITYKGVTFAPLAAVEVSKPATLAILSLGLIGVAFRRKKQQLEG